MEKVRIRKVDTVDLSHLDGAKVQEWIEQLSGYTDKLDTEIGTTYDEYDGIEIFMNVYREETDEEYYKRIEAEEWWREESRERRYKLYLKLKEEFENEENSSL